jgi:hypothetical protein
MLKIQFEIKLNEEGRPYIYLPDDYRDNPQDRFFALEISRYMLQMIYARKGTKFDEKSVQAMEVTLATLENISNEVAALLRKEMEFLGDRESIFQANYHLIVDTLGERDNLNYEGIVVGDKIHRRQEGLRVLVKDGMTVYELVDGIDNENWKEI